MYIILALDLHGLFSSRTPKEQHANPLGFTHPSLETTVLSYVTFEETSWQMKLED
jgi:hypothetical protein